MSKVRLGDVCRITMGQSPDSSTYNDDGIGVPFYQGNADFGKLHPTAVHWCTKPKKTAEKGDVLISVRAPIGALNIANEHCCIGRGLASITVNEDVAERDYIWYLLKSKDSYLQSKGTGSTFKAINKNVLFELPVDLPSKHEQKRISDLLSKSFELATRYNNQLFKLDELIKSRFVEMFGDPQTNPMSWESDVLSNIITQSNNGMARRGKDAAGSIVLRLVELQNGFIDYSNPNRIVLSDKEKKKYLLNENDFLFARVNGNPEYVGRCAVFHKISEPVYHNDHIIRVHFDEAVLNGSFARVVINSNYGKKQLKNQIKTSAGQYTISQDGIGVIRTILPPIELQNQFADFVTQVEKQKATVQQSIDKLETLKKSLMQEYFE